MAEAKPLTEMDFDAHARAEWRGLGDEGRKKYADEGAFVGPRRKELLADAQAKEAAAKKAAEEKK